jgi:hypothetical protein
MRWTLPILLLVAGFGVTLTGWPAAGPLPRPAMASAAVFADRVSPPLASPCAAAAAGPAAWRGARLWVGTLQGWGESPVVQAWRRFVLVTKRGPGALPGDSCPIG